MMKFLKKYKLFESQDFIFDQSEIDDICSLFRDFVDEFDLQHYDGIRSDSYNSDEYFTYHVNVFNSKRECIKSDSVKFNDVVDIECICFVLFFPLDCNYHINEKSIMSSIDDFTNRVIEMGYHVNKAIEYVDEDESGDINTLSIKVTI